MQLSQLLLFCHLIFQVLKTTGWAESTWTDNRLTWDPEKFGGIDRLNLNYHNVRNQD